MQQRRALARAPRGGEEFLLRKVLLRRPLQLGNALIADSLDERCQDFGARAKPIELVGGDMKIFEIARLHIGLLQHLEGIDVLGFITRPRLAQSCVDQLSLASQFDEVVNVRSEEHTSELQSLMRISYAVFCLKQKN